MHIVITSRCYYNTVWAFISQYQPFTACVAYIQFFLLAY